MVHLRRFSIALVIVGFSAPACPAAEKADKEDSFLRVTRNDRGVPVTLETSIATYTNGKQGDDLVTVDLISAVHVGDRPYYESLNTQFEAYDALLYELVAPEGTTPADRPAKADTHPVAAMQDGLKTLLDLEHQLDIVDYKKSNFHHADMSPEDFEKAMKERGESFLSMFFRMAIEGMRQQQAKGGGGADDFKLLFALMSPNRPMSLKRVMAEQFSQMENISAALDGPGGSAIVTDRNKKALEVLRQTLDRGKTKIGIFYGAAHMPDMQRRLKEDFGLEKTAERWLVAWDMRDRTDPAADEFLKRLQENRKKRQLIKK